MLKTYVYIVILLVSLSKVYGQKSMTSEGSYKNEKLKLNDGPYIFIEKKQLIEKKIIENQVFTKVLKKNSYDTIFLPNKSEFKNIRKIAALSDIHGKYELAIKLLKANKIIDKKLNWKFGKGHLVIVGDIFDRGNKVNEMLLLIYKLEQQADKRGGKVHFLLGNHEYMVLHKDLRYINKKYQKTSDLLGLKYNELYNNRTVIGRWLRSKSTIIKINNNVFVHGGISKDFISQNDFNLEEINSLMRKSIDRSKKEMKNTDFYKVYYGKKSLIWYRGYFNDNLKDKQITNILESINSDHIIVGHCSNKEVVSLYDNKIFGVDSSIKKGKYGEILFIKNNKYYRGTLEGEKKCFEKKVRSKTSQK
ncbi:metallophosphoesterase [Tenacibaculum halocynthiae]|uniref:metallophosphoesterase n=1 Tax=Tenacibaculum halocynthiae TaxID=1254437 RepID=UPI003D655CDB